MCFAPQRRPLFQHLNFQKWSERAVVFAFLLPNVFRATTACTFSISQLPKVVRTCGVYFFSSFFYLQMCFTPQRRALFRHLNFQKWSEHGVFCTFGLGNVLRATTACTFARCQLPKVVRTWRVFSCFLLTNVLHATTACTFSTSQLPKVVRAWCVLYIWTWKCASRHNSVHFFEVSTSKSGPNLACF